MLDEISFKNRIIIEERYYIARNVIKRYILNIIIKYLLIENVS